MTQTVSCPKCGQSTLAGDRFCAHCRAQLSGPDILKSTPGTADPRAARADARLLESLRAATLGEYDIYGELGRGGMAAVYLAHDIALDRKVAIKVLLPALFHTPGMGDRFYNEARISAQLSHAHIIPIHAVRETDELVFFVMKYVKGRSLDSIMRQVGRLPVPLVRAVVAEVGGALAYAHQFGVVHRDVKPSNILLDTNGSCFVTDFGIAKLADATGLTQTGQAMGTPTYMSPEQCNGLASAASDQYSLGIMVFEMLAGRPPFTGETSLQLMKHHESTPPPSLDDYRAECSERLKLAVARMLEKDPQDRWPAISQAMNAAGATPLAYGDSIHEKLKTWVKEDRSHEELERIQTPRSQPTSGRQQRVKTPAPDSAAQPLASTPAPQVRFRPDSSAGHAKREGRVRALVSQVRPWFSQATAKTSVMVRDAWHRMRPQFEKLVDAVKSAPPKALAASTAVLMVLALATAMLIRGGDPSVAYVTVTNLPERWTIAIDDAADGEWQVGSEITLELEVGSPVLNVKDVDSGQSMSLAVAVAAGDSVTVVYEPAMPKTTGWLRIENWPAGGTVTVNNIGVPRGGSRMIELAVGQHVIRMGGAGFVETPHTITIDTLQERTAPLTIPFEARPRSGRVTRAPPIRSPRTATLTVLLDTGILFVNGQSKGERNDWSGVVRAGTNQIRVVRGGLTVVDVPITLRAGTRQTLHLCPGPGDRCS